MDFYCPEFDFSSLLAAYLSALQKQADTTVQRSVYYWSPQSKNPTAAEKLVPIIWMQSLWCKASSEPRPTFLKWRSVVRHTSVWNIAASQAYESIQ